jgi:hypothetical protein
MNRHLFRISVLAITSSMVASACSSVPNASGNDFDSDVDNGLALANAGDDHASGTFTESGTSVRFEIAQTADGASMAVRTHDNQPLLEATRSGDRIDTSYLGGLLKVSGPALLMNPNQSLMPEDFAAWAGQISVVGDPTVLDRAQALPEFALLNDLGNSLDAAGVFAELVTSGQLSSGGVEKSAGVAPAGCGFFDGIICASVIAGCVAACIIGDTGCIIFCVGAILPGCEACVS